MTKTERTAVTAVAPVKQISFPVPIELITAKETLEAVLAQRSDLKTRAAAARNQIVEAGLDLARTKAALAGQLASGENLGVAQQAIREDRERREAIQWQIEALETAFAETDDHLRKAREGLRIARDQFQLQFTAEARAQMVEACKPLHEVMTRIFIMAGSAQIKLAGLHGTKVLDPLGDFEAPILSIEKIICQLPDVPAGGAAPLEAVIRLLRQTEAEIEEADRRASRAEQQRQEKDRELRIAIAEGIFGTLGWTNHPLNDPLIEQELARRASVQAAA